MAVGEFVVCSVAWECAGRTKFRWSWGQEVVAVTNGHGDVGEIGEGVVGSDGKCRAVVSHHWPDWQICGRRGEVTENLT